MIEITGRVQLIRLRIPDMLGGDTSYDVLHEFEKRVVIRAPLRWMNEHGALALRAVKGACASAHKKQA